MNENISIKNKILICWGLINSIVYVGLQVVFDILPFSFSTYKLIQQLNELGDIFCFGLYLALLITAIIFKVIDKRKGINTPMNTIVLIYSIFYILGLHGIVPLLLPLIMVSYSCKDKGLFIFNILTCIISIGGFLAIVTGIL